MERETGEVEPIMKDFSGIPDPRKETAQNTRSGFGAEGGDKQLSGGSRTAGVHTG